MTEEAAIPESAIEITEESQVLTSKPARPPAGGSTRLPPIPRVHIVKPNVGKNPKLCYNHVQQLRREMNCRLFEIDRKEKQEYDYTRTCQDFYRMKLDCLENVGEDNKKNMSAAIKVYLGQSTGSTKALKELIKIN